MRDGRMCQKGSKKGENVRNAKLEEEQCGYQTEK